MFYISTFLGDEILVPFSLATIVSLVRESSGANGIVRAGQRAFYDSNDSSILSGDEELLKDLKELCRFSYNGGGEQGNC